MLPRPDLTQTEVNPPPNNWCDGLNGGHSAPAEWLREGPEKGMQPTKFFRVVGHGVDMTVCEPCLIVAHWWSAQQKAGRVP